MTQNTSNVEHWNNCELDVHLRKINKNKYYNSFPARLFYFRATDGLRLSQQLDRTPVAGHTHPHHTHSERASVDRPVHLMCTSLGCWRKPRYLEKTHTDIGRTCRLHKDSGPSWNWLFSHPNKRTLKETTLFKALLYMFTFLNIMHF